jgi:hypothetical protein
MATVPIPNADFESGNVDWTVITSDAGAFSITNTGDAFTGTWSITFNNNRAGYHAYLNNTYIPVGPGQSITASCMCQQGASSKGKLGLNLILYFYDANQNWISAAAGNVVNDGSGGAWHQSSVTVSTPANTAYVRIGGAGNRIGENDSAWMDTFEWNLEYNRSISITSPVTGATYGQGDVVPLAVNVTGTSPPIEYVRYKYGATTIGDAPSPYNLNTSAIPLGAHAITAEAYDANDVLVATSAAVNITIVDVTEDREFKASNSYTNLVCEDFSGLTSNMPSTALVTGVELILDYDLRALIRCKDIGVADPSLANDQVLFDIVNNTSFEATLLQKSGSSYTALGGAINATMPFIRSDFTQVEDGLSEGKKWVWLDGAAKTVTLGADNVLFGLTPIPAFDFANHAIGVRHIPLLGGKPAYADTGDACIRSRINKLRLRVYFDAGSAEYYFASPDKSQIIKGTLVSSYVESGDFRTGDASGVLQLGPTLEVMDGSQRYIGDDWTIHAAYPPTDANQIGNVDIRPTDDGVGMAYNGLPGQTEVQQNRSRYVFITANFFGDKTLDSIYGAHGLPRAFAYNGEEFYKIHTQPDAEKDKPRHVANHHTHLALGYDDGRVDISVVGEPWNFDGADGASSWATGDPVTGLLPLSGTILGVFGSKSITGISGTTVDNFATQVISPNIGAIEYTITDMGFPVYANAYGIYTLSQTQQYGDYLGSPMSQDISPWLRPRLIRKETSDKEVVVAWPVRHKNQYRLAFSDGYILTMTMNGQQAVPTFSFQKYFYGNYGFDWTPIDQTDVAYNITYNDGEFTNSTFSGEGGDGGFTIEFPTPVEARAVVVSYDANGGSATSINEWSHMNVTYVGGEIDILNNSDNSDVWAPNPITVADELINELDYFTARDSSDVFNETYAIRIEVRQAGTAPESLYDYPAIVPIAVSSELDDSGQERIHIADTPAIVESSPDPEPPAGDQITVWGSVFGGSSGIAIDVTESFNSEVAGLDEVRMLGYYTPTSFLVSYPPSQDSFPIDMSSYTYSGDLEPTYLELDGNYLRLFNTPFDMPSNDYVIIKLLIGETEHLANVFNSAGV